MPLLNTADAIYLGQASIARAYQGDVLVWPTGDSSTLSVTLVKVANEPKVTVSTGYGGAQPDTYRYYLSENGGAWTYKYEGGPGPHTFTVGHSRQYQAKVESFKSGLLIQTAYSNTVTTDPAPPPPTQQKVWTGTRVEWGTWRGNGTQRYHNSGALYSGYYSSNHGNQRSSTRFNIPGDVRWCKSIDNVEVSAYNDHSYNYSGRTVYMALHHYSDLNSANGVRYGMTGAFASWSVPRDGWIGGSEWISIRNYICPGRYYVWDEFRRHGAQGISFHQAPTNSQGYYGYVRNDVRLRITYTVET